MSFFASALLVLAQQGQGASAELTDWQWDPETPICKLRQDTAEGGRIEFGRTPVNDETEITITLASAPKIRSGEYRNAALSLSPDAKVLGDVSIFKDRKGQLQIHAVTPDPRFIEQLSGATVLEVAHEKVPPIRIAIRSATSATTALRECEDRKMRAWGFDPASWRALKARPFPLQAVRDRFSALDYPREALAQGIETDAITLLEVSSDGNVGQCKGLNPGSYRGFEDAACSVLNGARFRPAVDSSGNPVSAPVIYDVIFRVEN